VTTAQAWRPGAEITTVGWVLTIGVIAALLAFGLLLATLRPHAVGYPEATRWSVLYIAAAVAFGLVFASIVGWRYGAEYFAGYLVEKSLSVDNLFFFVIITATFAVPREHQQRASSAARNGTPPGIGILPMADRPGGPAVVTAHSAGQVTQRDLHRGFCPVACEAHGRLVAGLVTGKHCL
jgi:hypothetical protein